MLNRGAVIEGQVQAGAEPDLEDLARCARYDLGPLAHVRIAATSEVDHPRKNESIVDVYQGISLPSNDIEFSGEKEGAQRLTPSPLQ